MTKKTEPVEKLEKAIKNDPPSLDDVTDKSARPAKGSEKDGVVIGEGVETPAPLTETPDLGYIGRLPDADGN